MSFRQGRVVDASIIDLACEEFLVTNVSRPDDHHAAVRETLQTCDVVPRIQRTIAKGRHRFAAVDDRDLNQRVSRQCFCRELRLIALSPAEQVTSGHPPSRFEFTEDNPVEMKRVVVDRECAAALLSQILRGDPDHQSLVSQSHELVGLCFTRGRKRAEEQNKEQEPGRKDA